MNDRIMIHQLPIDAIRPNPDQPRIHFESSQLEELAASIQNHGVFQPIHVRKQGDFYLLIAGERRLRASKLAGKTKIPAIVVEVADQTSAALAMIENLQRQELSFLEEALGYRALIKKYDLTQTQVAKMMGKSQSAVANKCRLLKLSEEVLRAVKENGLTERHTRALLMLSKKTQQLDVIGQVAKKQLTVKATENLIERIKLQEKVEEQTRNQKIKSRINPRIYLNTLKNAWKAIEDTGAETEYEEIDHDEFVEVVIRIQK